MRIEWFDAELDAMRTFDLDNQRSIKSLEQVKIAPLTTAVSEEYNADIFDYCVPSTLVIVDEPMLVFSMLDKRIKKIKGSCKAGVIY